MKKQEIGELEKALVVDASAWAAVAGQKADENKEGVYDKILSYIQQIYRR